MENDSFQFNNSAPWFVGSWTDIQNILWKTFDSSVLKVDFKEKIFFDPEIPVFENYANVIIDNIDTYFSIFKPKILENSTYKCQ